MAPAPMECGVVSMHLGSSLTTQMEHDVVEVPDPSGTSSASPAVPPGAVMRAGSWKHHTSHEPERTV